MLAPLAYRHGIVLLATCGLLATTGLRLTGSPVAADDVSLEGSAEPVEGILVMRTGAVISGKIVRSEDFYKIISPYGQIHVPVEQVKLHCADLEEAYSKLRETDLSHKSANAHITLARWCLTNHLDHQARQELHEALVLAPDREDARRLLREVEDAINSKHKDAAATLPESTGRGARPAISPENSMATGVDDDAVTLGVLSREQAMQFTRRIQPLLINTCASAGCHSPDSQIGFRLNHVSPRAISNRNATERNLAQILGHVDLEQPRASSLLTVPRRHHGRNGSSVFVGHRGDEKFTELENWVVAVARNDMQRNQHDARRKSGDERARAGRQDASRSPAGGRSGASGGKFSSKADPFARSPSDATGPQTPLPQSSIDPFDPASYNRSTGRGTGR